MKKISLLGRIILKLIRFKSNVIEVNNKSVLIFHIDKGYKLSASQGEMIYKFFNETVYKHIDVKLPVLFLSGIKDIKVIQGEHFINIEERQD